MENVDVVMSVCFGIESLQDRDFCTRQIDERENCNPCKNAVISSIFFLYNTILTDILHTYKNKLFVNKINECCI